MKNIFTRPLSQGDIRLLDQWRRAYKDAFLELPKDFNSEGVKSVGLHEDHQLFGSLTGIRALVIDPFIHNPSYDQGAKIIYGLVKADAVLTHWGQEGGAVDSYIAIPNQLPDYIRLLGHYGYKPTCQNCTILRRPLLPDFIPLIENERK